MATNRDTDDFRLDAGENRGIDRPTGRSFDDVLASRLSRRAALTGLGATVVATTSGLMKTTQAAPTGPSSLAFKELALGLDQRDHVAEGYDIQVLVRWGDKVAADAPAFDPNNVTAASQEKQFGYNNDFLAYLPLPVGSRSSENGLLVVNHEYTNTNLIFAGIGEGRASRTRATKAQCEAELAAHGLSVLEIRKAGNGWQVVENSRYNRRIHGNTPITVSGPAAGHDKLKTSADPTGMRVLGTLNNCAGGWTPWGTMLTAEENFNGYFGGNADGMPDRELYRRYGVSADSWYAWWRHIDRFNVEKERNEPNRHGWIVEFDPYDPAATPVKRTALGRFKHEGCHSVLAPDGRVVIYSGDDERGEYVYKFVTEGRYNPNDRAANRDLLDRGTLFVAQFHDNGGVIWLPIVHGQRPLTAANGFDSQADILINTRRAGDLLAATPMDRPEDIEPNPVTGRVTLILTNNSQRTADRVNRVNPRAPNPHGHIIEIIPPAGAGGPDHASVEARWEMFLLAGKPGIDAGSRYHRMISEHGWLSCPDNCAFDSQGRIWIATDGAPTAAGIADGVWAADVSGPGRALTRHFYHAPTGAEVCGPIFTPDDRNLFLAIQHPGENEGSTFERPSTRWPDFQNNLPPRPAVVVVTKRDGGVIGS